MLKKHVISVDVFTFKTTYLFTSLVIHNKLKIVVVQGTLNAHSLTH
jgi:hypothetical protein